MSTIETIGSGPASSSPARARVGSLHRLGAAIMKLLDALEARLAKRRSRRVLMELTEYQLKDIGLTRLDAINEARLPFWK